MYILMKKDSEKYLAISFIDFFLFLFLSKVTVLIHAFLSQYLLQ
jgi:hypothetical protein